ncbi:DinB/UmuC family translesion DNA polymerase [Rickettsia rhipicephali]|uniref:DinB/UmuC family translesion DNA polymerase n=1 Tax=Rickettsia rhipicephali TaxID=33992 RepID=UPI00396A6C83
MGNSQVLALNLRNVESARIVDLSLFQKATYRLRARKIHASRIILTIQTADRQVLR